MDLEMLFCCRFVWSVSGSKGVTGQLIECSVDMNFYFSSNCFRVGIIILEFGIILVQSEAAIKDKSQILKNCSTHRPCIKQTTFIFCHLLILILSSQGKLAYKEAFWGKIVNIY